MKAPPSPQKFALYCKSYRDDVLRAKRLLASIQKHNITQIPVYLSTPRADRPLFEMHLGDQGYVWIADEQICAANPCFEEKYLEQMPGYLSQQVVKAEFWRLGLCEAYLCLDSDSVFIRDFSIADFVDRDGVVFTVMHDGQEFLDEAQKVGQTKLLGFFREESARLKSRFGRVGVDWDFGPTPAIWSAAVWQDLHEKYFVPRGENLWIGIAQIPTEIRWYGEALLKFQSIPLRKIGPLFRVYHAQWQFLRDQKMGITQQSWAEDYLGVLYQSNWELALNAPHAQRSWFSRAAMYLKNWRIAAREP